MHILQVTIYGEMKFGGPPQKIFALGERLTQAGHQVTIVTFHTQIPQGAIHMRGGVRVVFLPWRGLSLWQVPLGLRMLRRQVLAADVVHLYGLYNLLCPLTALLAWRAGKPYLLEPLGMFVPRARSQRLKALFNRLFTSPMANGAACIVATSLAEENELQILALPNKIVLRRNGLDVESFRNLPDCMMMRQKWGVMERERVILYVGRISPIKNLEVLVRAFKRAMITDARLILVGPQLEAYYAARLQSLISTLELEQQVIMAGPLYDAEKMAALSAADLFVLPSQYESFGNAAAEAVAAGVPVLLTEGCGIAQLIHGRAGLAVPATEEDLARGLQIMVDPTRHEKLVQERFNVVKELSWEEPLHLTQQLYRCILNRNLCGKHHVC